MIETAFYGCKFYVFFCFDGEPNLLYEGVLVSDLGHTVDGVNGNQYHGYDHDVDTQAYKESDESERAVNGMEVSEADNVR